MKKLMYFLLVTPFFLLQSDSFADDGYNNFLFSAYFKAQKLRVVAMENMEKLEKRIMIIKFLWSRQRTSFVKPEKDPMPKPDRQNK